MFKYTNQTLAEEREVSVIKEKVFWAVFFHALCIFFFAVGYNYLLAVEAHHRYEHPTVTPPEQPIFGEMPLSEFIIMFIFGKGFVSVVLYIIYLFFMVHSTLQKVTSVWGGSTKRAVWMGVLLLLTLPGALLYLIVRCVLRPFKR